MITMTMRHISVITAIAGRALTEYEIDLLAESIRPSNILTEEFVQSKTRDLIRALTDGRRIEAIKLYKELTFCGLRTAKDAIEGVFEPKPSDAYQD